MVREELGRLARLALPMMLTQLSQMGMGVADTMMAGRVSAADLAGIALGGNLFWPLLMFISGIIMSITPSVSQLHGAGRERDAGEVVRQALWIALVGGGLLVVLLQNAEPFYHAIGVDPIAIPISVAYLQALSWGVLPVLGYFALRYMCEGMSWTLPAMAIALSALLMKIPLNYLFIYGGFGVPAMGGVGCGWSSAIVMTYEVVIMAAVVAYSRMRVSGLFMRFSLPDVKEIWRLTKLGIPIGASTFLEFSMFSVMTLLIGRLGVDSVAAHMIASNIGGLTFMIPLALGMAGCIRVGYTVGTGDLDAARRSGRVVIGVSAIFAVVAAVAVFFGREFVAGLYTNDASVYLLASELLLFVAFYQLFDDTQVTAIGALRGYKDTNTPMWVAAFAYWGVGFPVGISLGFGLLGAPVLGVSGFWWGLFVGLAVAAVVLLSRFRWLSHQTERVLQLSRH